MTLKACLALALLPSVASAQTLVAHYELNETSGTVAADSSGNGNNGTYTGGVTLGQPGVCSNSTAVLFNGFDSYVDIPASASLDALLSDFTVTAWVNQDVDQLHRVFASERDNCAGNTASWAFGPNVGGGMRFTTLGVQDFNQASSLTVGNWHHIACVFDAAFDAHFYLDGVLQGTVLGGAPAGPATLGYFIGLLDLACFSEYFSGSIDDVQVYAGSATAADIQFLFQNPCSTLGGGGAITVGCDPANAHTQGGPATMANSSMTGGAGSSGLHVEITNGPSAEFGYLLVSGTLTDPGVAVSNGIICMTAPIGRYNAAAGAALNSTGQFDAAGVFHQGNAAGPQGWDVPTALPNPPGGSILPQDTWYFQLWFRDGTRSNFSNAICVTF